MSQGLENGLWGGRVEGDEALGGKGLIIESLLSQVKDLGLNLREIGSH